MPKIPLVQGRAVLVYRVLHSCAPSYVAHSPTLPTLQVAESLFLQRLLRPASRSPLHCWQPSIFGCWPSGVELLSTGGHVATVSGDLPHSTQDVSVE